MQEYINNFGTSKFPSKTPSPPPWILNSLAHSMHMENINALKLWEILELLNASAELRHIAFTCHVKIKKRYGAICGGNINRLDIYAECLISFYWKIHERPSRDRVTLAKIWECLFAKFLFGDQTRLWGHIIENNRADVAYASMFARLFMV